MKKRQYQVGFTAFLITTLLIAGAWGLMTVDMHSRRYGAGSTTPMLTAQISENMSLQLRVLGREGGISLDGINRLQGFIRQWYAFVPRQLRIAVLLGEQGRLTYEDYQAALREQQFREYLLADGF